MYRSVSASFLLITFLLLNDVADGQISEICGDSTDLASTTSGWMTLPMIYGKVVIKGVSPAAKFPRVTISLIDKDHANKRSVVDRSGNYCFQRPAQTGKYPPGGLLVVEVEGAEVASRMIPQFSPQQHREDFEIIISPGQQPATPPVVPATANKKQIEIKSRLYKSVTDAEKFRDTETAIKLLREIVIIDPLDHIAWSKLGSLYVAANLLPEAESAFTRSVELKPVNFPALINLGKILLIRSRPVEATEYLRKATALDPNSPRAFQLLGESFLLAENNDPAIAAFNESLRLDPAMVESHLRLSIVYDRMKRKDLAARELKIYLEKVPNYADKEKLERYIEANLIVPDQN